MRAVIVESGEQFNRWTVLAADKSFKGHRRFMCQCACGTIRLLSLQCIRDGKSKSCGCLQRELAIKHGMHKSAEYRTWAHMHQRCKNPKTTGYHNYGGRGIRVCDHWRSFEAFYADMGSRPSKEHTLERIDNNSGYSAQNCRWATRLEQHLNKRATIWERVLMLLAGPRGETLQRMVKEGVQDQELANWIARVYKPEATYKF